MTVPQLQQPYLLNTTIVPDALDAQTFLQYLTRLYEDIAFAVNKRDFIYYPIAVSATLQPIPNLPLFGSYIILVSGEESGMPCVITAITKNSTKQAGLPYEISDQNGTEPFLPDGTTPNPWFNVGLIIQNGAATPTGEISIQIRHDGAANLQGNFHVRIIGTQ